MPPAANRLLVPRAQRDISSFYPILFPILGAFIFVGALLWGYCTAHWRHRLSNNRKGRRNAVSQIDVHPAVRGAQFRYVFPRHPEFASDQDAQAIHDRAIKQVGAPRQTPVSTHKPRYSPSSNRVTDFIAKLEGLGASPVSIPPRRMPYLHAKSLPALPSDASRDKVYKRSLSGSSSRELVLVSRCKSQAIKTPCKALIAPERPSSSLGARSSTVSLITARNFGRLNDLINQSTQPSTAGRSDKSEELLTPHKNYSVQNRFDTPSSWTPSLEFSPSNLGCKSVRTVPKHPLHMMAKTTLRRNASKLVTSRQPKGPFDCGAKETSIVAHNMIASPSAPHRSSSGHMIRVAFRPVSAPADGAEQNLHRMSDMVRSLRVDRSIDRNPQALSFLSATSSDLLHLFPKPLTFRRTFTSHSPLSAPTASTNINGSFLGSYFMEPESSVGGLVRRTKRESPWCRLSALNILHRHTERFSLGEQASFEHDPFVETLQRDVRRSDGISVNSNATLKPPPARRPASGAASSVYSREPHDGCLHASPAFTSEGSTKVQQDDDSVSRAVSFDESIFRGLDWMHETTMGNSFSRLSDFVETGASVGRSVSCHVAPSMLDGGPAESASNTKAENLASIYGSCLVARSNTVGAKPSYAKLSQHTGGVAPGGAAWV